MNVLEPALTEEDLRVLAAVSPCGGDEWRRRGVDEAISVWQVAEELEAMDLSDVNRTLGGLMNLGYVWCALSEIRKRTVWWRTLKGDRAVARGEIEQVLR